MRTKHDVTLGALRAALVAADGEAAAFSENKTDAATQRPFFTDIVPKRVLAKTMFFNSTIGGTAILGYCFRHGCK